MQMDFQIPYGYEEIRSVDATGKQTTSTSFGLGDISAGLQRQLTTEHGKWPDMLVAGRFKSTTGKDAYNLSSSEIALGRASIRFGFLTMAKSNDPVVFFGSLAYTANLPANHTTPDPNNPGQTIVGHFDPGDAIGFPDRVNPGAEPRDLDDFRWDQRFTRSTSLNGVDILLLIWWKVRFGWGRAMCMRQAGRSI